MADVITTRREGTILEVTLDRPKANAIDLKTSRLMGETFKAFRDDPTLRVAIVKTAGDKFFCAGWDLKAAAGGDAVDGDYGVGGFAGLQELRDLNKPVIACVNGMAVGGGFELALSCDLIYASDHSSFALPEIRAGAPTDTKDPAYLITTALRPTGFEPRWIDPYPGGPPRPGVQRSCGRSASRGFGVVPPPTRPAPSASSRALLIVIAHLPAARPCAGSR